MAAFFAFLGMLLASLLVAVLAALQLGDFFMTGDEFIWVIGAVAAFSTAALGVFAAVHAKATRPRALDGTALLLALAAIALVLTPGLAKWIAGHATDPYTVGDDQAIVAIEIAVPVLLAVLVQWGLVRRRRLRVAGEEDMTRWPWVTTVVAGLVILNPVGLAVAATALNATGGEMMWQLFAVVAAAVAGTLVVMAAIECYIRGRILRRRLGPLSP